MATKDFIPTTPDHIKDSLNKQAIVDDDKDFIPSTLDHIKDSLNKQAIVDDDGLTTDHKKHHDM